VRACTLWVLAASERRDRASRLSDHSMLESGENDASLLGDTM